MKSKKIDINNWSYKSLLIILFFLLINIVVLWKFVLPNHKVEASWWNDGWNYRKAVSISNTSGSNLTDFQISLSIGTSALIASGKMQSDCDDIRITDINGNLLPYWIEENNPGCNQITDTKIWIKANSIPTSGATIFIYYGNSSAPTAQSGDNTFDFFDDFNDGVLDTSKWQTDSGTITETSSSPGYIYENSSTALNFLVSKNYIFTNGVLETKTSGTRTAASSDPDNDNAIMWRYQDTNNFYYIHYDFANPGQGTVCSPPCDDVDSRMRLAGSYSGGIWIDNPTLDEENHWYNFKASAIGSSFNIYYSKVGTTVSWGDSTWTSGKIGLGSFHNEESARFDYVFVHKYASVEPTATLQSEEAGGGPIAYWKFDEGSGTTAYDSTTNQNNGTLGTGNSAPTWADESQCISGKCFYFDGVDDKININNVKVLSENSTISFWVKGMKNNGGHQRIISFGGFNGILFNQYAANYEFYTGGSNSSNDYILGNYLNKWHQISIVTQGSDSTYYIDGKYYNIKTGQGNPSLSNFNIEIGNLGSALFFNGFLDEIKIYPYARTADQIKKDYNSRGSSKGTTANLGGAASDSNLSDGLVGYWKMDEGIGTTTADYSGNSNTGTFGTGSSAPSWSSGKFGIGTSFDGVDDFISISNTSSLITGSNPRTISAWIKPTSTTSRGMILTYGNNTDNQQWDLEINGWNANLNGKLIAHIWNAGIATSGTPIIINQWNHVVVSYGGGTLQNGVRLFVNGVEQVTENASGTANSWTSTPNTTATNFQIGKRAIDNAGPFPGILDEVRLYNRALSPSEVSQLYEYAPGPIGYWDFNDGSGTTAKDKSGNNNNGTLGSGNSTPTWTNGKYGSALKYDGSDDYSNIPDSTLWDFGINDFTMSLWAKINSYDTSGTFLISQQNGASTGGFEWYVSSSNVLRFNASSSINLINASLTPSFNTWNYYTVTRNGTTLTLYSNGKSIGSTVTSTAISNVSGVLTLGKWIGDNNYNLNGSIDDVKIYNYARTQKQIIEDMTAGGPAASTKSVIGYWKFDEGSGSTAYNFGIGGTALNGTLTSMASPATTTSGWNNFGKFGKALSFDASDDYVDMGNSASLTFGSGKSFTYGAWIYSKNPFGRWQGIVYHGDVGQSQGHLGLNPSGQLEGGTGDGSSWQTHETSYLVPQNTWVYIVMTLDRNLNILKFYANGVEVGSYSHNYIPSAPSISLRIGEGNTGGSEHFNGLIDEVKIYNYALTSDEVKQDYNSNSALQMGQTSQTIGGTTTSLEYCIPGDTSYCASPVAEWKMDEGSGNTAYDTSGNNINGTWQGTLGNQWSQGKIGKAGNFNGSNNYLNMGDILDIGVSNLTVSAWIKTSTNHFSRIVSKNAGIDGWFMGTESSGTLNAGIDGVVSASFPATYNDNKWHNITTVWNRSNALKVFFDGRDVGTTLDISSKSSTDVQTADNLTISTRNGGSGFFNGQIDQVRVYNYARTPAQVAYDYNKGGPVGWWKFDECQGNIAYDWSGIGNTGTIIIGASGTQNSLGTCSIGTSAAWTNGATGKLNSSLNFDGTDDYVSLSSVPQLGTGDFSISLWTKINSTQSTGLNYHALIDCKNSPAAAAGFGLVWNNNVNKFLWSTGDGSNASEIFSQNTWTSILDQWTHVVMIRKTGATNNGYFYINGKYEPLSSSATVLNVNTATPLRIGNLSNLYSQYFFTGQIDDVRIYNYALTPEQVKTLYNNGAVNFN